jgi:XTP/dITP diphosphohydrolase
VALLLDEMRDVPDARRAARFHCVVALADASRPRLVARGVVEGRIARAAAGVSGFGYDPVFVPDGHERTFAELGLEVKNRMSHRARALAELRRGLDACLADLAAGAEDRNRG